MEDLDYVINSIRKVGKLWLNYTCEHTWKFLCKIISNNHGFIRVIR
jgi:hypothetical protein